MTVEKKRLLILDDSREFVFLLSTLFDFHKFEIDTEENPEDAFKKCEEKKFDVIITDFIMHPYNGIEFSKKVRNTGLNIHTKIVLLTAKNLEEDQMQVVRDLNVVYLKKPILPNKLQEKIMEIIG